MRYEKTFPTRRPKELLKALAERFAGLSFRIEERNDHLLRIAGPGCSSSKQNPLLSIARGELRSEGAGVHVVLELVEVSRLLVRILLAVFLPLIALFVVVPIIAGFTGSVPPRSASYWLATTVAIGGNILMWAILMPFIGRVFRRRSVNAVETLFANLEKL
jgi:hypothetical protein